jgi:hypothetical protein
MEISKSRRLMLYKSMYNYMTENQSQFISRDRGFCWCLTRLGKNSKILERLEELKLFDCRDLIDDEYCMENTGIGYWWRSTSQFASLQNYKERLLALEFAIAMCKV